MANLKLMSKDDFIDEVSFTAPIPGEAFTRPRRFLPMDRPPEIAEPKIALEQLFFSLTEERNARDLLALLDAKVPVDTVAKTVLDSMVTEGVVSPMSAVVMAPSLITMLIRMAQGANVDFKMSTDDKKDTISSTELIAAKLKQEDSLNPLKSIEAAKKSSKELSELPESEKGLLKRPEEIA